MKTITDRKFNKKGTTLTDAINAIRLIALDVDGVLTDGRIGYSGTGDEIKFFNIKDGSGITMLRRAGFLIGIISGRKSKANQTRASELKLDFLVENCWTKWEALKTLAREHGLSTDECLFVGDDMIDGQTLANAGIGVAVGDASPEVVPYADVQTQAFGGCGAVREVAEWLLKNQNKWEMQLNHYHLPEDQLN